MGKHFNPVKGWVNVLPSIGAIALETRQPQLGLLSSGVGSTEPTASFQGEYLSEEPTCDHRSLITLTLLRDLGGSDAADHGQYPILGTYHRRKLDSARYGYTLAWRRPCCSHLTSSEPDPGFPRPVAF